MEIIRRARMRLRERVRRRFSTPTREEMEVWARLLPRAAEQSRALGLSIAEVAASLEHLGKIMRLVDLEPK